MLATNRAAYLSLAAVMAGIGIVSTGNGLLSVFLAVRMTIESFPPTVIGLVVTAYSIGFLIGCLVAARPIRAFGHAGAFVVFALLSAVASLAFAARVDATIWAALRLVNGFAVAGLFVAAESWLADRAPKLARGRVFGFYMITTKVAYGGGQLMLMVADPAGYVLFLVASLCYGICLVPVALARAERPNMVDRASLDLLRLLRISPVAVTGCFLAGMNNSAIIGLGPVFAVALNMDTARIAWFNAAIQFGSMLMQYPIGRFSDRGDRRYVLLAVVGGTIVLALALAFFTTSAYALVLGLATFYGGLSFTLYPICLAHAADRVEARQLVSVSGGLLMAWAVGATIGPLLASWSLQLLGPAGLFLFVAATCALFLAFVVWRMNRRRAGPLVAMSE